MDQSNPNSKETLEKESNKALIITGVIIALFVAALVTNGFGLFSKFQSPGNSTYTGEFIPLSIGQAPVLGEANAPVTMYVFSDFSCPYCAAAAGYNEPIIEQLRKSNPDWEAPLPGIIENYVKTGKVKLVYKYSSGHGAGQAAHLLGWNLNDQDLFWKFHDKAFENQARVADLGAMKDIAKELGANMTQLEEGLNSNKYNSLLTEDNNMGISNGVQGTPSFFINGKMVSGARSYEDMAQMIDRELSP